MMADAIEIPDATAEPDAYVASLMEALGERSPIEQLGETVPQIRRLTADLDVEQWAARPGGEWSVEQNAGHLFDVDICYGHDIAHLNQIVRTIDAAARGGR